MVPGEPAAEAGLTAVLPQDQALLQHQNSLSSPRIVLVSVTKVSQKCHKSVSAGELWCLESLEIYKVSKACEE